MQTIHGCPHYQRNCHVEAPCCKLFYPCKICHDQKIEFKKGCQTERMQFQKVEQIKCLNCQEIQLPTDKCIKCQIQFGKICCLKCKLYENNPQKLNDIFHCEDCKMCRRGTPQTVTHCFTCGYCVPNQNQHKCIVNNGQSKCPVCLQILLFSTKGYISLKCGHLIHVECWQQLGDINCPTCGMATVKMPKKMSRRIQKQIKATKSRLPAQLKDKKVNIICNECLHKTIDAAFHYYGIKCGKCGTFNTKMI